ncbi:MAG: DUF4159 domain-containing protein [Elusimicrobiota bacterium]|nr:DUF4159 domain-containing protein [Elusimicrobiota bacterium]
MKLKIRLVFLFLILLTLASRLCQAQNFQWVHLSLGDECVDNSGAFGGILDYITTNTSITVNKERKAVKISDDDLFDYPFITLSCKSAPRSLSFAEILKLRKYLMHGGTLFINNRFARKGEGFDNWVKKTTELLFSENSLMPFSRKHAALRSFFLIKKAGGRFIFASAPSALDYAGRSVIIYSKNDLLGIWPKGPLGRYQYRCIPGGEEQRKNGKKLLLNIILYGLTGTYKLDAVHQPHILRKLRMMEKGQ